MADFLGKSQVQVGGSMERRVENLGADLASLMGAVGKGVEVYNKAGETAAKLEAYENIRRVNDELTSWERDSKLVPADNKEFYEAYTNRYNELMGELTKNSSSFAGHKEAYDTYLNLTANYASERMAADIPKLTEKYQKAIYMTERPNWDKKVGAVAVTANHGDFENLKNELGSLNQFTEGELDATVKTQFSNEILNKIEQDISSTPPVDLLEQLIVGKSNIADPNAVIKFVKGKVPSSLYSLTYNEESGQIDIKSSLGEEFETKMQNKVQYLLNKSVPQKDGDSSGAWATLLMNTVRQNEQAANNDATPESQLFSADNNIVSTLNKITNDPRFEELSESKKASIYVDIANARTTVNHKTAVINAFRKGVDVDDIATGAIGSSQFDAETGKVNPNAIMKPVTVEDVQKHWNLEYTRLYAAGKPDEARVLERQAWERGFEINNGGVAKVTGILDGKYNLKPKSPQESAVMMADVTLAKDLGKIDSEEAVTLVNALNAMSKLPDDNKFSGSSIKILTDAKKSALQIKMSNSNKTTTLATELAKNRFFPNAQTSAMGTTTIIKDLEARNIFLPSDPELAMPILKANTIETSTNFLSGGKTRVYPLDGIDSPTLTNGLEVFVDKWNSGQLKFTKAVDPKIKNLRLGSGSMQVINTGNNRTYSVYYSTKVGDNVRWNKLTELTPKSLKIYATEKQYNKLKASTSKQKSAPLNLKEF